MKAACEHNKELLDKVVPSMAYKGGNIEEWKVTARKKLVELIGLDRFTKVNPEIEIEFTKKIEGATEIRFTFKSEDDYRVPCHLLLPDGVENPPVMICLQGHSKGMHISLGRPIYEGDEATISGGRDFAIQAIREGFAAITLEQRSFGECGGTEKGPDCYQSAMRALLMGRTTIGERVWDVSRLIDVLETEFSDKVNVKKICLMGNSGGGTATAYTAALEDRIILAVPSCAMCAYKDSIGAMFHCSCNYIPQIANYFDMGDLLCMAYPKYYVQVSGMEDKSFPIGAAEEVFNKGKLPYEEAGIIDKCVLIKGSAGHRFYPEESWPVIKNFVK